MALALDETNTRSPPTLTHSDYRKSSPTAELPPPPPLTFHLLAKTRSISPPDRATQTSQHLPEFSMPYPDNPRAKVELLLAERKLNYYWHYAWRRKTIRGRHSAITAYLDVSEGNVRAAQSLSRHQNLSTLMIYDDNRHQLQGKASKDLGDLLE